MHAFVSGFRVRAGPPRARASRAGCCRCRRRRRGGQPQGVTASVRASLPVRGPGASAGNALLGWTAGAAAATGSRSVAAVVAAAEAWLRLQAGPCLGPAALRAAAASGDSPGAPGCRPGNTVSRRRYRRRFDCYSIGLTETPAPLMGGPPAGHFHSKIGVFTVERTWREGAQM